MIKFEKHTRFKDQHITNTVEMDDPTDQEIEVSKEVVRGVYLDNMEILKPQINMEIKEEAP